MFPQALKEITNLIIASNKTGSPLAFMRTENNKLEMLFVSTNKRGKGIGTKLIQHEIKEYSINEVTVNEQNPNTKRCYKNNEFKVYKRTETDEQ